MNPSSYLVLYMKINTKYIVDLNVRTKTIKLPKEKLPDMTDSTLFYILYTILIRPKPFYWSCSSQIITQTEAYHCPGDKSLAVPHQLEVQTTQRNMCHVDDLAPAHLDPHFLQCYLCFLNY